MRRLFLPLLAVLGLSAASSPAASETVLRAIMHSDLKIIDPAWTTALITAHHGYLVYDTLFSLDEKLGPAANGREVGGLARQAHLDLHPARRPGMA